MTVVVVLTDEQQAEIERLAQRGKSGGLNDLADQWGVPFRVVVRAYATAQIANNPQPDQPPAPAPASKATEPELTAEQLRIIRRLAEEGKVTRLTVLAEEWGIPHRTLARRYQDTRAAVMRTQVTNEPSSALPMAPSYDQDRWHELSPVANVTAEAGAIGVLPRNWPLIQARLASGKSTREISFAAGMTAAEYTRVEEGRQLPTPDQAARICALLGLGMEQTFAVAGQEQFTGRGGIRGLSLLALLRARRRINMRQLSDEASKGANCRVSQAFISAIERNTLKLPLTPDQTHQVRAMASYLKVPDEWITAQVPPTWIQTVATNTAQLHTAFKVAYQQLPTALSAGDPERLLAAPQGGTDE